MKCEACLRKVQWTQHHVCLGCILKAYGGIPLFFMRGDAKKIIERVTARRNLATNKQLRVYLNDVHAVEWLINEGWMRV